MNRTEWKAFCHSLRADARAFAAKHGGYPTMTRHFSHEGEEWSFTRLRSDNGRWVSYIRKSLIRERSLMERVMSELNDAPFYRAAMRQRPWASDFHKRGLRKTIIVAREIRMAA